MTRPAFSTRPGDLAAVDRNGYATHSAIGSPVDFYVFVAAEIPNPWSKWIKGRPDIHQSLTRLRDARDVAVFRSRIEQLFNEHKKEA